jgi:LysM repeat protein
MKRIILIVCLLLPAIISWSQQMTTQQYINTYKDLAIEEMHRTGVPAAISLAQGIVESESGNGWLVQHSNNNFGIKCKDWTGPTIRYDDDRKNDCFRKYATAEESWRDHSDFLKDNVRYAFLFQLDPTDYRDWAYGLKQAGYATSPTYAQKLVQTIQDYNLEQYTLDGLGQNNSVASAGGDGQQNLNFINETNQPADNNATGISPENYPAGVFTINTCRVLYLSAGSSLLAVADKYHIKLRKLVNFNELQNDDLSNSPELIYLQRKMTTGNDKSHIVENGETMYSIAQEEGIQLKWLYKRNRMEGSQEPAVGEKLVLVGYASTPPQLVAVNINSSKNSNQQLKFSPTQFISNVKSDVDDVLNNKDNVHNNQAQNVADTSTVSTLTPQNLAANPGQTFTADTMNYSNNGIIYHIVQPDETLFAIAKKYNTSVSELQMWNNLPDYNVKIGQRLMVGKEKYSSAVQ